MPHECTECGRAFEDGSKEMLSGCPDCGGTTFQFRPEGSDPPDDEPEEPPEPPEAEIDGMARTVGNAASAVRNLVTGGGEAGAPPGADDRRSEAGSAAEADRTAGEPATASQTETDDGQYVTTNRREGLAQSDARSDIIEADELPSAPDPGDRPPVPDPRPISAREGEATGDGGEGSEAGGDTADGESADSTGDTNSNLGMGAGDPEERPSLSELRAELNDQFESIRVVEPGQYELNLMELYDREEYIIALQEDGKYTIQLPERWEES